MGTSLLPPRRTTRDYSSRYGVVGFGGLKWFDQNITVGSSFQRLWTDNSTPNDREATKDCTHERASSTLFPVPKYSGGQRYGSVYEVTNWLNTNQDMNNAISLPLESLQRVVPNWQPDIDNLISDAVNEFIPDFNLWNFILEADEIPKLFTRWQSLHDLNLRVQYGWLPLISELDALRIRLFDFGQRWERMTRKFREGIRVCTGREIDIHFDGYSTSAGRQFIGNKIRGTQKETWGAYVCAQLPENPFLVTAYGLGLGINLATVWNAVPFSFMVDWLIPIGDALSQPIYFNPYVKYGWKSTAREFTKDYFSVNTRDRAQRLTIKTYNREAGVWDIPDGVQAQLRDTPVHLLNPAQWAAFISLMASMIR